MHSLCFEDVNCAGKRCRNRRNENRIAPVFEFLNNEGRNESLFDLRECRSPYPVMLVTSHPVGEAADHGISGYSLEQCLFGKFVYLLTLAGADREANEEADHEHE